MQEVRVPLHGLQQIGEVFTLCDERTGVHAGFSNPCALLRAIRAKALPVVPRCMATMSTGRASACSRFMVASARWRSVGGATLSASRSSAG